MWRVALHTRIADSSRMCCQFIYVGLHLNDLWTECALAVACCKLSMSAVIRQTYSNIHTHTHSPHRAKYYTYGLAIRSTTLRSAAIQSTALRPKCNAFAAVIVGNARYMRLDGTSLNSWRINLRRQHVWLMFIVGAWQHTCGLYGGREMMIGWVVKDD